MQQHKRKLMLTERLLNVTDFSTVHCESGTVQCDDVTTTDKEVISLICGF